MKTKLINIEEINSFIYNVEKEVLPKLREISKKTGDFLYIVNNEKRLQAASLDIKLNGIRMNFEYFNQYRREKLCLGGFSIRNPLRVNVANNMYGLFNDELIKKDIYFIFLLLRPLFEGLNHEIETYGKNCDSYWQYHCAYNIDKTYKLVKGIISDIHCLYGNIYDYGLSECESILYILAIEFKCDLRPQNQKILDNTKEISNGCFETIFKIIFIALIMLIFYGIVRCAM